MPTINTYLPIGESDLDNALPCDSIAPVNFRRPASEFVYELDDIQNLKEKSLRRQQLLPEFAYINKDVNRHKNKREETTLSLNLQNRRDQKIKNQKFSDLMSDDFEVLSKSAFFRKNINLNIVDIQNTKSREVRGEEKDDSNTTNLYNSPSNFDIRLHETCRVMSDWVGMIESRDLTHKKTELKDEI